MTHRPQGETLARCDQAVRPSKARRRSACGYTPHNPLLRRDGRRSDEVPAVPKRVGCPLDVQPSDVDAMVAEKTAPAIPFFVREVLDHLCWWAIQTAPVQSARGCTERGDDNQVRLTHVISNVATLTGQRGPSKRLEMAPPVLQGARPWSIFKTAMVSLGDEPST